MPEDYQRVAREVIGWLCIAAFFFMGYLTLQSDVDLPLPMIIGMLLLIALLLGKLEEFVELAEILLRK